MIVHTNSIQITFLISTMSRADFYKNVHINLVFNVEQALYKQHNYFKRNNKCHKTSLRHLM